VTRPAGIVLAAGRGSRLAGRALPFAKPLVPVGGRPVVAWAAEALLPVVDRLVAVVNPTSAGGIEDVLRPAATRASVPLVLAVQDRPTGAAEALAIGLAAIDGGPALMVCGDNVLHPDAVIAHVEALKRLSGPPAMTWSFQVLDGAAAARFAVLREDPGQAPRLVEKPPDRRGGRCWCGPVGLTDGGDAADRLRRCAPSLRGELEMTDLMNGYLASGRAEALPLAGPWFDIGTESSLAQAEAWFRGQGRT
jgi:glucose-1-phosphate thymidylyltransferase